MRVTWFLARRYLGAHRGGGRLLSFITWISLGGVVVGVSALVVVIGVMAGMQNELRSNILEGNAHILVWERRGPILVQDWRRVRDEVLGVEGIEAASPLVWVVGLVQGPGGFAQTARILGVEGGTAADAVNDVEARLREGTLALTATEPGAPPLVVGSQLATLMTLFEGDSVTAVTTPVQEGVQLDLQGNIGARVRPFVVTGTIATGDYQHDAQHTYTTLEAAQDLLGLEESDAVSMIAARTDDPERVEEIAERIRETLGFDYYVETWMTRNGSLLSALKLEKLAMGLILFLIVIVAAFNIVSTLVMVVADRTREIGILKSMGMSRTGILRVFMVQGAWIGVVGTCLGATLGVVACWVIDTFEIIRIPPDVYLVDRLPVLLDPFDVLIIVGASVALAFLAPVYPSIQASRLEPVEAIRHE